MRRRDISSVLTLLVRVKSFTIIKTITIKSEAYMIKNLCEKEVSVVSGAVWWNPLTWIRPVG